MRAIWSTLYQRAGNFTLALILAISTLTAVGPFISSQTASAVAAPGTYVVTGNTSAGENQEGWMFGRDSNNQTPFAFSGADSSIGTGSLYVAPISGTPASNKLIAENFLLSEIADIDSISYDYKLGPLTAANQFYMNVYMNFGDTSPTKFYDCRYDVVQSVGSAAAFNTAVFDLDQDYTVTRGTQSWNLTSASHPTCPTKPSDMGGDATIRMFSINVGDTTANDDGMSGYIDNVRIATTTGPVIYDFEATTPTVTSMSQLYQTNQGGRIRVTLNFSEAINPSSLPQGWNGSGTQFSKVFYSTQLVNLGFMGLNSNAGSYSFTVDKTAPTVTNVEQVYQTNQGGRVSVTLTFSEAINPSSLPQGWYGSGTQFTKAFYSTKPVTVNFTDLVGNPGSYSFDVDMTAPDAPSTISPEGWQSSFTKFTWTPVVDAASYNIRFSRTHFSSVNDTVVTGITTNEYTPLVFADGPVFWQVQAVDAVGNPSEWSNNTNYTTINGTTPATIDSTAPVVSLLKPLANSVINGSSYKVRGSLNDMYPASCKLEVYVAGTSNQVYSQACHPTGNFSAANIKIVDTTTFEDGTYDFVLVAKDVVGHESTAIAANVTIDNTAPTVELTAPTGTLFNTDVEVRGSATDSNLRHYWVKVVRDGATVYNQTVLSAGITNGLLYTAIEEGEYEVTFAARDTAGGGSSTGNRSDDIVKTFTIDKTAPVISVIGGDLTLELGDSYIELGATSIDAVDGVGVVTDITGVVDDSTVGVYTVTYTITDAAGNTGTAERIVTVVDTTDPTVVLGESTTTGNVITPAITADDLSQPLTFLWTQTAGLVGGVTLSATDVLNPTFTVNTDGTYEFLLTVTDAEGNETTQEFGFTYTTPVTPAAPAFTATTPPTPAPTPAVLGDTTETTPQGDSDVEGVSTQNNVAAAATDTNNDGKIFGLAWYWWLLILAALAALAWWIAAALRRRNEES